ncbi:MAG: hypothetical protein IKX24_03900 [Prevotella sp.]|nr:hypothetical protein [Prevotella sp.]
MASAEKHEIEMEGGWHIVIFALPFSLFNQKHEFNNFYVAFIIHKCGIRILKLRHFSGTDATQKLLNCHICKQGMMPYFFKTLVFSTLQNTPFLAFFRPKVGSVANNATMEGQSVTFI